jgi:hypothetical protein
MFESSLKKQIWFWRFAKRNGQITKNSSEISRDQSPRRQAYFPNLMILIGIERLRHAEMKQFDNWHALCPIWQRLIEN